MSPQFTSSTLIPEEGLGPSAIVARRLRCHSQVSSEAAGDLGRLLGRSIRFEAGALIAAAGDSADLVTVVQDGLICRMSQLPDGRRQIHTLLVPGDTADAEASLLNVRTDSIEAISDCTVWLVPKSRLASLFTTRPALAQAFAREAAVSAQVAREWVVNIGRRNALERIAHLICELYARLDAVGLVEAHGFAQPLTQQDIGEAQGVSAIHVNRVMQQLRTMGLICTDRRRLTVLDLPRLQDLALFDPLYLHLEPHRA